MLARASDDYFLQAHISLRPPPLPALRTVHKMRPS
jgi:hypothetical protein